MLESSMQDVVAEVYPWQQHIWHNLSSRFPNIGHGLLFYGKQGCGKEAFAQQFLAWVLCQQRDQQKMACGHCGSCQWLQSNTHPNFVHITTDDDAKKPNAKIKIDKIRDLLPFVQQTVDGWRVILIEPAEALNIASANALLKTLEEPGERVLIILLAEHYLKLPATIRSRLQHFALDRMRVEQATRYLQEHLPADAQIQNLNLLLNLSNQMPLRAIELAEKEWLNLRADFLQDWLKLVENKNSPLLIATKWQKALAFTEFCYMFEYLLADVVAVKLNQQIKNIDLSFERLAKQYHLEQLFAIYSELQQAKKMLEQNVQTNLLLDELCIKLMNI